MNRRNFIRALISIPIAAKLPNISAPIKSSLRIVNYDDKVSEFIYYYKIAIQMHVSNPRTCMYITNIGEWEK